MPPHRNPCPVSPHTVGCSAPGWALLGAVAAPGNGSLIPVGSGRGSRRGERAPAPAELRDGTDNFRHPTQQPTLPYRVPIFRAPGGRLQALEWDPPSHTGPTAPSHSWIWGEQGEAAAPSSGPSCFSLSFSPRGSARPSSCPARSSRGVTSRPCRCHHRPHPGGPQEKRLHME